MAMTWDTCLCGERERVHACSDNRKCHILMLTHIRYSVYVKKKKKKQASLPAQFMSGAEWPTGNSPGSPDGHSGPGPRHGQTANSLLKTSRLRTWITGTMFCGLMRPR